MFKAYILYGMQYCCALIAFKKKSSCDDFDIRKMCICSFSMCVCVFVYRKKWYYNIYVDSSGKLYRISLSLWLFSFVRSNYCSHNFCFIFFFLYVIFVKCWYVTFFVCFFKFETQKKKKYAYLFKIYTMYIISNHKGTEDCFCFCSFT